MNNNDIKKKVQRAMAVDYIKTSTHRDELLRALESTYRQSEHAPVSLWKRIVSRVTPISSLVGENPMKKNFKMYAGMTTAFVATAGLVGATLYSTISSPSASAQALLNDSAQQVKNLSSAEQQELAKKFDNQDLVKMLDTAKADKDLRTISKDDAKNLLSSKSMQSYQSGRDLGDGGYEYTGYIADPSEGGSVEIGNTTGTPASSDASTNGDGTNTSTDAPSEQEANAMLKAEIEKQLAAAEKFVAYEDDQGNTVVLGLSTSDLPVFQVVLS